MPGAIETQRPPGAPPYRNPVWVRAAAFLALGAIFWLDTLTPIGVAIPALYVVPIVFFIAAGRFWEPLAVAAASTLLLVLGIGMSAPGGSEQVGMINRPLEALVFWFTAALVAQYRRTVERWTVQYTADQRSREETLQRLQEIRYALDQAAIVATTDQRGVITYVNEKFCEISKYSREELLGQDHRIINSGYHPKEFIRELWRTIAQGRIWRGELRNRAKDGSIYWVDTTIVPFLNDAGKPRQYLAIRSDITQRKHAEQQLADQSALAQLGQLAAVVAHEVRNPLAGVKGSLQILRSRVAAESSERPIFDAMIARLDVLNVKVDDILRFARSRAPSLEPVDARAVVIDAIASARAAAGSGCPDIVPPGTSAVIRADREMFRDVLLNLLLNACQSGTTGPVEVELESRGDACRIAVLDRGAGIAPDQGERVFEPFFTTKKSGTGLGLAIVRRLVSLQSGSIALLPRPGGGTVAELSLPLAASRAR